MRYHDHLLYGAMSCSTTACPTGCVVLQFGTTMVHLSRAEFRTFMVIARNALHGLNAHDLDDYRDVTTRIKQE